MKLKHYIDLIYNNQKERQYKQQNKENYLPL